MHGGGFFIAGTDTDVGKTVVAAAFVSMLRAGGIDAAPMKPVQTGATRRGGRWISPDLNFLLEMGGLRPGRMEYRHMSPCCFSCACSPHLAAALESRRIKTKTIAASFDFLRRRHASLIVEGAGGVLVPLGSGKTMLDLVKTFMLPVIVVARPGLGTINHTLLAIQCLRRAGAAVSGVVINSSRPAPHESLSGRARRLLIEKNNAAFIAEFGGARVLASLPFMPGLHSLSSRGFARIVSRYFPPISDFKK